MALDHIIEELEKRVREYTIDGSYVHDSYIYETAKEALASLREGNFGVGAVLVDRTGKIIQTGRNKVFYPYFRSDRHAEMDLLNSYEEKQKSASNTSSDLTLFSSLEPCPMCFSRIITAGIAEVYYAANDDFGGMVHLQENLPIAWKKISEDRIYQNAKCSPSLSELCFDIFAMTVEELDRKLQNCSC